MEHWWNYLKAKSIQTTYWTCCMCIAGNQKLNSIIVMLIHSICEPQKWKICWNKCNLSQKFDLQQNCCNLLTFYWEMQSCECSKTSFSLFTIRYICSYLVHAISGFNHVCSCMKNNFLSLRILACFLWSVLRRTWGYVSFKCTCISLHFAKLSITRGVDTLWYGWFIGRNVDECLKAQSR